MAGTGVTPAPPLRGAHVLYPIAFTSSTLVASTCVPRRLSSRRHSGGKVLSAKTKRSANRARQALKMAAMSLSRSGSALGAFYRRLCSRMDKPSANTATAHKLARMVYFMLTRGEDFVDQGQQHYEEQQHQRSVAALKRRATALGFEIKLTTAPA